ncbi:MAG: hypothetical protein ACE5IW_14025, partial [bacterium]
VVPLLNGFGGVNSALLTAATAALGAVMLVWSRKKPFSIGFTSVTVLTLGFITLSMLGLKNEVPISKDLNKDMYRMLTNPLDKVEIVESRWSAFGRTDLVSSALEPNIMTIFVDGAAGSPMFNLDSLLSDSVQVTHLISHFSEGFPFFFLNKNEKDSALIIGSGGGRDVVVALLGAVKSITAVEVNPDLVQIVKDYAWFNGGIYTAKPNVQVVVAEGRNHIRSTHAKYDLIMLAIPIIKSSRSVEGYALTENYLFTVESFEDYLDHLTPEGRIIIVAHDDLEIYRLISLALTAFEKHKVSQPEAMKHIYTIASGMMPTIVIKKQPFDSLEVEQRHALLHKLGFDTGSFFVPYVRQLILRPNEQLGLDYEWRMFDQILVDISTGRLTLDKLIEAAIVDIGPVTDDNPFFYKLEPGLPKPFGIFSLLIVLTSGFVIGLVLIPKAQKDTPLRQRYFTTNIALYPQLKTFLLIFFFLGMGFMLIEIALFQKLMLFIGQPVLALTVLLFSLFLGTGLGSLTSSMASKSLGRAVAAASLTVFILTFVYALSIADLFSLAFDPKITATLLLVPLGFVMGFPFPLSIRLMKEYGLGDSVYLMWGFNGVASVLGSALTMIIGILLGFSYALYLGAILYAGVGGLAILL